MVLKFEGDGVLKEGVKGPLTEMGKDEKFSLGQSRYERSLRCDIEQAMGNMNWGLKGSLGP